jgi:hypothetical protein
MPHATPPPLLHRCVSIGLALGLIGAAVAKETPAIAPKVRVEPLHVAKPSKPKAKPPQFGTGMPRCDRMIQLYDAIERCDRVGVRDSMMQGEKSMQDSWGDVSKLDGATRQTWDDSCAQADEGLETTIKSLGCDIPQAPAETGGQR